MSKAAIRAKAKEICSEMRTVDYFYTEADGVLADHLTQAYEQGWKKGYKRGWYEAVVVVGPDFKKAGCDCDFDKEMKALEK